VSVEHLLQMDDDELGAAVASLDLAWPTPSPGLADEVVERIGRGHPRSRVRWVLVVAAALLLLAAAAVAARLVIDLGAIKIEHVPSLGATPSRPVRPADLGTPVMLAEAAAALGYEPTVPASLGPPDRIWLTETTTSFEPPTRSVAVTMAWRPRPGLPRIPGTPFGATLMQVTGDVDVIAKIVDTPWRYEPDHGAYWITRPHQLQLLTRDGLRRFAVTGHTLLWQADDRAYRLEVALPLGPATRIAFG
jgi:hypothetical protein